MRVQRGDLGGRGWASIYLVKHNAFYTATCWAGEEGLLPHITSKFHRQDETGSMFDGR